MNWARTYADDDHCCSFCRKGEAEAGELIGSPNPPLRYICRACVAVCSGSVEERSREDGGRLRPGEVITVKFGAR